MREGCSNDVEALAHNLTRRLTMGRHSHRVNSLSEKDNATIRKWQETGRENLTERSRMYSQRESLPSDGTTSDVMTETSMHNVKEATDPLSSTNAQYAVELLKDGFGVDPQIRDNIRDRLALTTPITVELKNQASGGLSDADIKEARKGLLREAGCLGLLKQIEGKQPVGAGNLEELKMSETAVAFFKTIYYGENPEIMLGNDPAYQELRKVTRATLSKVFVNAAAKEHFSVRDWFTSRGIQPRPVYTCSLVSNSDLLLGQGPNGGHGGSSLYKPDGKKGALRDNLTKMTSHIKELWMSGNDINQRIFHRVNRDEEVIGFLVGLKQMDVGVVIALGNPRSYNMLNVKTMLYGKGGYADADVFSKPGLSLDSRSETYKRNTARDFFNYFGAKDGDDGLPWRDIGDGVRKCQIQDFELTSILVKTLKNSAGWPMDLYELKVVWRDGCLCASVKEELSIQVLNIRTWDQSPSMLVADEVDLLVETILDKDRDNKFVFIHCAGGIGRTGNIAYGLSEIMCSSVPKDPLKKLEWFRSFRPGCIQTPEQLVDGMVLSNMILQNVIARCEKTMKDRSVTSKARRKEK